ncbi:MAG TPA: hypothetical protein VEK39_13275 [Solirubrobacterales bacterium]|nr:hypothetical protein [Solirubrobacterales bacterium]
MSPIYEAIGRVVVWFVRVRFRRQLRIAAGVAVVAVVLGGYLAASRSVDEG